ncbi:MAG: hypothetical protein KC586_23675, partial [Myxococcales bacterium]|nr:hypothetical protein [Myxococcales bacterium]
MLVLAATDTVAFPTAEIVAPRDARRDKETMATFDSTKTRLATVLDDIMSGKIQLPDFQRGWVW